MDIKLVREHISEILESKKMDIFYCDKENSHKDMMALMEYFEKKGKHVYFREVKYGLDEGDYMYEFHIL